MYDYLLNEQSNWQRHQEDIREAEKYRLVRTVQAHHQSSPRIAAPVRRAAQLVAALIR